MARSPKGVAALPSLEICGHACSHVSDGAGARRCRGKSDMSGLTRSASCDISQIPPLFLRFPTKRDGPCPMHTCIASLVEDNAIS